jgi:hypothetical protein
MMEARGPARLVTAVLVVAAVLLPYRIAFACTCDSPNFPDFIDRHEAVIVGTIEHRSVESGSDQAVHEVRVERVLKGDVNERIEVVSHRDGATCGMEAAVGSRVGLGLTDRGDRWGSGLCSTADPDEVLAAAGPGSGPPGDAVIDPDEPSAGQTFFRLAVFAVALAVGFSLFNLLRRLRERRTAGE